MTNIIVGRTRLSHRGQESDVFMGRHKFVIGELFKGRDGWVGWLFQGQSILRFEFERERDRNSELNCENSQLIELDHS